MVEGHTRVRRRRVGKGIIKLVRRVLRAVSHCQKRKGIRRGEKGIFWQRIFWHFLAVIHAVSHCQK